jgi:hypothetical protein
MVFRLQSLSIVEFGKGTTASSSEINAKRFGTDFPRTDNRIDWVVRAVPHVSLAASTYPASFGIERHGFKSLDKRCSCLFRNGSEVRPAVLLSHFGRQIVRGVRSRFLGRLRKT